MPYDSEGNFTRIHSWEEDRVNDIDIVSDRHDEEDDNFAEGLNNAFLRDGRVAMQGSLNMNHFQIRNTADGTAMTDVVNKRQLDASVASSSTQYKSLLNNMWVIGDIKTSLRVVNHGSWLLCNGQEVSRTTYADLFALIGTRFGAGNGTTTFNVPDYRGKFLRGLGGHSESTFEATQSESIPFISHRHNAFVLEPTPTDTKLNTVNIYPAIAGDGHDDHADYIIHGFTAKEPNGGKTSGAIELSGLVGEHVTPINQAVNFFIKAKEEV